MPKLPQSSEILMRSASATRRLELDVAHGAHVVLVAAFVTWRVLEATPITSSLEGARFATSLGGRGLTLTCIVLGVGAFAAIAVTTWRRRTDVRLLGLLAALVGATWQRAHVDALDIAYALVVTLLASLWFGAQRATTTASA